MLTSSPKRWRIDRRGYVLLILMLVFSVQYLDRTIVLVLAEPIKHEFGLTDARLGLLSGFVFSIPYGLMLLPFGMLADRLSRRNLLAGALAVWSLLTLLTGLARNLTQMVLARAAIAGAEAANTPNALSLLADLYGKRERGAALGAWFIGPAVATVLGFTMIGIIATRFGWRTAFFIAGIPGLLIALLLLCTVREPLREGSEAAPKERAPPLGRTLKFLLSQRSLCHLMLGMMLTSTVVSAQVTWLSPLLIRIHHMSLTQAAVTISIAYGIALALGQLVGGAVVDRLAARDLKWVGRSVGLCSFVAGVGIVGVALAPTVWVAIAMLCVFGFPSGCQYGPVIGSLQGLVAPRMRGVTSSVLGLFTSLIGAGLGPYLAGKLSDLLVSSTGAHSIGYALIIISLGQLWAMAHFFAANRTLKQDMARVGLPDGVDAAGVPAS